MEAKAKILVAQLNPTVGAIEENKKKIDPLPREPFTRFSNIQVIKKSSDNEVGLFRSSVIF